jgi:hypothetical protein
MSEYIDATPTWEEITPALIEMINGDNEEAAKNAMVELRRMSQLADRMKLMVPAINELLEDHRKMYPLAHPNSTLNWEECTVVIDAMDALTGKPKPSIIIVP